MGHDLERDPPGGELERLVAERGNRLMAIAIALTGERADAEDLLQTALERLLRHRRASTSGIEAYLRRTLYNLAADGWRRRGRWRRTVPLLRAEHARTGTAPDGMVTVDLRDELVRLLRQLPPHQRAVIMLRYWEQRSETETAEMLGCTQGAVKSAASKGLHRLRELTEGNPTAEERHKAAAGHAPTRLEMGTERS
jgi:RNA polymerase sigma-70 factor (sigma-E family)